MRPASPQQQYNEDGTPRRKYEPDDTASGRYVLSASIGFVLANAFVLAKNLMFGGESAQKQSPLVLNAAVEDGGEPESEKDVSISEEDETYGDGQLADQPDGGTVKLLHTALSAPRKFGDIGALRLTSGPTFDQTHGNDNVTLYGSAPGRSIVLFSGDDGRDSLPLSGAGGGSGSGAATGGGSGTGGGQNDDPGPGDSSDDDEEFDPGPSSRVNRLPVIAGPVILPTLLANQSVVVALSALLGNASDPDGDQLSVRNLSASSGALQIRSDGSWNFTPDYGDTSGVTFTYTVSDGNGGVVQTTAALDLVPVDTTIVGTDGSDTIVGTPHGDVIDALGGDDIVLGREGDDVIFGGDGNDRIVAGDGNDVVYAGAGDDAVFGGSGNDIVFGGGGNDLLYGDEGNDVLVGEAGDDTIWGGAGNDRISGGDSNDSLYGDEGDDFLDGGAGHNYLDGGIGDDTILVRTGDTAIGGDDPDMFILAANPSVTVVPVSDPGSTPPVSTTIVSPLNYSTSSSQAAGSGSTHPPLADAAADDGINDDSSLEAQETNDALSEATETGAAENPATQASHSDTAPLSKAAVTQILSIADDPISVPENEDEITHIDGGDGRDTIDASAISAPLQLNLKIGAATSTDIGHVTIVDVEDVKGGSGPNTIVGSDVGNNLAGGASADTILGEDGRDQIDGEQGDDILAGGKDADDVSGGDGRDIIIATIDDGDDHYDGGAGLDAYNTVATSADMTIDLETGTASSAETGTDTLTNIEDIHCGSGDDTIVANTAVNTLAGGEGQDTFVFDSVAAIGKGSGSRDRILDFAVGDRINLDNISDEFVDDLQDAFGDQVIQRFVLIGAQETFTQAGQMKFHYEELDDRQVTILEGNIDSDAEAEFELELVGQIQFRDDDFTPRY